VKKAKVQVLAQQYTLPKKLDTFSYNRHKTSMKLKAISDLQSHNMVTTEMRITTANHMEWIKSFKPTSKMVLDEFLHLKDYEIVSLQYTM